MDMGESTGPIGKVKEALTEWQREPHDCPV